MHSSTFLQYCVVIASFFALARAGLSVPKISALAALSPKHVIPINDKNYQKLMSGNRDYHLLVFLTSNSVKYDCMLCRQFEPHFRIVADSYAKLFPNGILPSDDNANPKNIYFAIADFEPSRRYFSDHKVDNIPKIFHYPPGDGNFVTSVNEFAFMAGDHTSMLLDWVTSMTGIRAKIIIPIDWSQVMINAAAVFSIIVVSIRFRSLVFTMLTNRGIWSALSMVALLLLTGGYMFNLIRAVPYVQQTPKGISYIIPGQSNQVAAETQIVSFFYGFMSILVIMLVKRVPQITNEPVQFITVSALVAFLYLMYSGLLNVFAIKMSGYPFQLLKVI